MFLSFGRGANAKVGTAPAGLGEREPNAQVPAPSATTPLEKGAVPNLTLVSCPATTISFPLAEGQRTGLPPSGLPPALQAGAKENGVGAMPPALPRASVSTVAETQLHCFGEKMVLERFKQKALRYGIKANLSESLFESLVAKKLSFNPVEPAKGEDTLNGAGQNLPDKIPTLKMPLQSAQEAPLRSGGRSGRSYGGASSYGDAAWTYGGASSCNSARSNMPLSARSVAGAPKYTQIPKWGFAREARHQQLTDVLLGLPSEFAKSISPRFSIVTPRTTQRATPEQFQEKAKAFGLTPMQAEAFFRETAPIDDADIVQETLNTPRSLGIARHMLLRDTKPPSHMSILRSVRGLFNCSHDTEPSAPVEMIQCLPQVPEVPESSLGTLSSLSSRRAPLVAFRARGDTSIPVTPRLPLPSDPLSPSENGNGLMMEDGTGTSRYLLDTLICNTTTPHAGAQQRSVIPSCGTCACAPATCATVIFASHSPYGTEAETTAEDAADALGLTIEQFTEKAEEFGISLADAERLFREVARTSSEAERLAPETLYKVMGVEDVRCALGGKDTLRQLLIPRLIIPTHQQNHASYFSSVHLDPPLLLTPREFIASCDTVSDGLPIVYSDVESGSTSSCDSSETSTISPGRGNTDRPAGAEIERGTVIPE